MPEKGVDTLIEAWRGVRGKLHIVGGGPDEARLRAMACDEPQITFTGHLEHGEVQRLVSAAKFMVFPSRWPEPFGLGIIEAFAAGRPVLACDIGAPKELVTPGVTGMLVAPDDPERLHKAVRYMLCEHDHRNTMGLGARRRYLMRHTPQVHRRRLMDLFGRLSALREQTLVG
jgi:glycosyltransferase involved in cell wall biosynthesis